MTTEIKVANGFKNFDGFTIFRRQFKKDRKRIIKEWNAAIKKRAIFGMKRNKTGKPLPKKGSRNAHRASRKGQYPAVDTGRLWRSIRTKTVASGTEGRVYTNVRYGKWLEEKDPNRGGRPFLSRAAREKQAFGRALVFQALERASKKGRRR